MSFSYSFKANHRRFMLLSRRTLIAAWSNARSFSSDTGPYANLTFEENDAIGMLTMNRPPANTLSLEMFNEMSNAIKTAEANTKTEALVLASNSPKIFCAGLDLSELYRPEDDRLHQFSNAFQQLYLDLYGSRLSTFAAMGGHAPAAGCMLALSCDYRIMSATEGKIGLNESLLGIVAPPWMGQQYIDTIGHRKAALALSLGRLFSPQEAFEIGLVDELVHDLDVVDVAKEHAKTWVKLPSQARMGVKKLTRADRLQELIDNREADTEQFCSFIKQDNVQGTLKAYVERLASRKK